LQTVRAILDWGLTFRQDDLPIGLVNALKSTFEKSNPKYYKNQAMGFYVGNLSPLVRAWSVDGPNLILPRGARARIEAMLNEAGFALEVQDETVAPLVEMTLKPAMRLRPHQEAAVAAMLAAGGGLLRGPCGCGKTILLMALLARLKTRALVIMHSGALMHQWEDEINEWLTWTDCGGGPGTIVGGKFKGIDKPIVLAMQQTVCNHVGKYEEWTDGFGIVAYDEAHHASAASYQAVLKMFRAKYFFGVTADERRKDGLEFLTEWALGPMVHKIERENLVAIGRLLPIEMKVLPTEYEDDLYLETIENEESPNWVSMVNRMLDPTNPKALKTHGFSCSVIESRHVNSWLQGFLAWVCRLAC
jgi:hypothetical protein